MQKHQLSVAGISVWRKRKKKKERRLLVNCTTTARDDAMSSPFVLKDTNSATPHTNKK